MINWWCEFVGHRWEVKQSVTWEDLTSLVSQRVKEVELKEEHRSFQFQRDPATVKIFFDRICGRCGLREDGITEATAEFIRRVKKGVSELMERFDVLGQVMSNIQWELMVTHGLLEEAVTRSGKGGETNGNWQKATG